MRKTSRMIAGVAVGWALLTGTPVRAVDDADELLPGKLTLVRPGSLFKMIAKPVGVPFALPGAGNEPTAAGASLHVFDVGVTGGDDTYALPAAGWKGLGNPPGSKGYKYKGAGSPADPCKVVLVKPSIVKAVCKGSGVSLSPPAGGALAVILTTTGAGSKRYCASFGGVELENSADLLKRKDAAAVACVGPAVCGDGTTQPPEQCDDGNTTPNDGCDASCLIEETTSSSVGGGVTVTSDDESDGATAADPLETAVTTPNAGTVTIFETSPGAAPAGFELRGQAAVITAPDASSSDDPLEIVFEIDATQIRPGETEQSVQVFRSGVLVEPCLGAPGTAVPEPCVGERTLLPGGDVRLRVFATHTSPWWFGYPLCGNGTLDGSEACDPPAGGCGGGQTCKPDCTCAAVCDCCAGAPATLTIAHDNSPATCGSLQSSTGATVLNFSCNTVYFGGGGNTVPPFPLPDAALVLKVTGCSAVDELLTLGPTTSAETGSVGTCTSAGCRFGAPTAVPNPASTPTSTCVVPTISQDMSGLASCGGVISQLGLPLTAEIFLTGDSLTDPMGTIAGIQPCPLCSSGTCIGGPNAGLPCVADNSTPGAGYPTSNHCPPDPTYSIGTIPIGAALTTGAVQWTGTPPGNDSPGTASGVQTRVFAGWCRDADFTGAFESPAHQCWENGMAVGTPCTGTFEACRQRNNGAFGPAGGANMTINQLGSAPGCLADELPHPAQVVGPMRIPPSFEPVIDAAADLPGPGTMALEGTMQLQ